MLKLLTNMTLLMGSREGFYMMAMLWTQQILLGKKTFAEVPRLLKDAVRELLNDSGYGELTQE